MAHPDDFRWQLGEPLAGDRAIRPTSQRLAGRTVALLLSGGIASYRGPDIVRALRRAGADVYVFVTPAAQQFVTLPALEWTSLHPPIAALDATAQHVGKHIDVYLVAPASYSTINKAAHGVADNAVTTALASALGQVEQGTSAVVLAPTMHGTMVNAILRESLAKLANLGCKVLTPRAADGKALLPDVEDLVDATAAALSKS